MRQVNMVLGRDGTSAQIQTQLEDHEWDKLKKALQNRAHDSKPYLLKCHRDGETVIDLTAVLSCAAEPPRQNPPLLVPGPGPA